MKIRTFAHKGLKTLYVEDSAKGVPFDAADKLRKMFAFLDDMEDAEEIAGAHRMESPYINRRP